MRRGRPSPAPPRPPERGPAPAPGGATRGSGAPGTGGRRTMAICETAEEGAWVEVRRSVALRVGSAGRGSGFCCGHRNHGRARIGEASRSARDWVTGGSRWPAGVRRPSGNEPADLDRSPVVLRVPEIELPPCQPAFRAKAGDRRPGRQGDLLRAHCGYGFVSVSGEGGFHRGQSRSAIHARTARRRMCRPRKAKGIHRSMSVTER